MKGETNRIHQPYIYGNTITESDCTYNIVSIDVYLLAKLRSGLVTTFNGKNSSINSETLKVTSFNKDATRRRKCIEAIKYLKKK